MNFLWYLLFVRSLFSMWFFVIFGVSMSYDFVLWNQRCFGLYLVLIGFGLWNLLYLLCLTCCFDVLYYLLWVCLVPEGWYWVLLALGIVRCLFGVLCLFLLETYYLCLNVGFCYMWDTLVYYACFTGGFICRISFEALYLTAHLLIYVMLCMVEVAVLALNPWGSLICVFVLMFCLFVIILTILVCGIIFCFVFVVVLFLWIVSF